MFHPSACILSLKLCLCLRQFLLLWNCSKQNISVTTLNICWNCSIHDIWFSGHLSILFQWQRLQNTKWDGKMTVSGRYGFGMKQSYPIYKFYASIYLDRLKKPMRTWLMLVTQPRSNWTLSKYKCREHYCHMNLFVFLLYVNTFNVSDEKYVT